MKTLVRSTMLAAILATSTTCGRVSVDVGGNQDLQRANKGLKALRSFKEVIDAWRYAIDNIQPDDERAIGQATTIALIARSKGLVEDQPLNEYVNRVGNLVSLQGERKRAPARRFFFFVLDEDLPTAYSVPGGHILVTRGLLEQLTSEAELAFVLGHEIAHVDLEHGLGALKTSAGAPAAVLEALRQYQKSQSDDMGWADKLWDRPDAFGGTADQLIDVAFASVDFMKESQEKEADALGLQYAVKAGYDSRGAERVLEMLSSLPSSEARTHEPAPKRLERLRKDIDKGSSGNPAIERWNELAAPRLAALAGVNPQ